MYLYYIYICILISKTRERGLKVKVKIGKPPKLISQIIISFLIHPGKEEGRKVVRYEHRFLVSTWRTRILVETRFWRETVGQKKSIGRRGTMRPRRWSIRNFPPRVRGYDEENTRRTDFFWGQRSAICQNEIEDFAPLLPASSPPPPPPPCYYRRRVQMTIQGGGGEG